MRCITVFNPAGCRGELEYGVEVLFSAVQCGEVEWCSAVQCSEVVICKKVDFHERRLRPQLWTHWPPSDFDIVLVEGKFKLSVWWAAH